jgi:predicted O-linked N-acetylglucosamine transferase (SPINDLY family)
MNEFEQVSEQISKAFLDMIGGLNTTYQSATERAEQRGIELARLQQEVTDKDKAHSVEVERLKQEVAEKDKAHSVAIEQLRREVADKDKAHSVEVEQLKQEVAEKDKKRQEALINLETYMGYVRQYKARIEEQDNNYKNMVSTKDAEISRLERHIQALEKKLVVANRLSQEQILKGQEKSIKASQDNAEADREKIAQAINSWIYHRAGKDTTKRVDLAQIVAHTGVKKSTIYAFRSDLANYKIKLDKYGKYEYFVNWFMNGGKFANTTHIPED